MYSETIKAADVVQQIKESVIKEMAEKEARTHELKSRSAIKRFLDAIDKSKKHRGKEVDVSCTEATTEQMRAFFKGYSRAIDIGATTDMPEIKEDYEALSSDWEQIGRDFPI